MKEEVPAQIDSWGCGAFLRLVFSIHRVPCAYLFSLLQRSTEYSSAEWGRHEHNKKGGIHTPTHTHTHAGHRSLCGGVPARADCWSVLCGRGAFRLPCHLLPPGFSCACRLLGTVYSFALSWVFYLWMHPARCCLYFIPTADTMFIFNTRFPVTVIIWRYSNTSVSPGLLLLLHG